MCLVALGGRIEPSFGGINQDPEIGPTRIKEKRSRTLLYEYIEYTGIYLSKDTERGPPGAGNLAGWAGRVQYLPYS